MTIERKKKAVAPVVVAPAPYAEFALGGHVVVFPIVPQSNPTRTIQVARAELRDFADRAEVVLHADE